MAAARRLHIRSCIGCAVVEYQGNVEHSYFIQFH